MYHHHAVVAAVLCSMTFCFAQAETSKTTETKSTPIHQTAVVKSASDTAKTGIHATMTNDTIKAVKKSDTVKTVQTAVAPTTDTAKTLKNADTNKTVKKTDTAKNIVPANAAKPTSTSPSKPAVK